MLRLMVCRGLVPEASTEHHRYTIVWCRLGCGGISSPMPQRTRSPPPALNHESSPTYVVDFAGLLGCGRVSLVLSLCLGADGEGARNAGTGADGYGVGDRAGDR